MAKRRRKRGPTTIATRMAMSTAWHAISQPGTTAAASTARPRATTTEPTEQRSQRSTRQPRARARRKAGGCFMEFFRSMAETVTRDRMVTLGLVSGNSSGVTPRGRLSRSNGARRAGWGSRSERKKSISLFLSLSESLSSLSSVTSTNSLHTHTLNYVLCAPVGRAVSWARRGARDSHSREGQMMDTKSACTLSL